MASNNYFKPYQMQFQLLQLCTFLSSVEELSKLLNKFNFQKNSNPGSSLATPGQDYNTQIKYKYWPIWCLTYFQQFE